MVQGEQSMPWKQPTLHVLCSNLAQLCDQFNCAFLTPVCSLQQHIRRRPSPAAPPCCAAAGPVTTALETALLANYAGSNALAAFAAVNTSANFATRIFNFLVDGVSAKVGKSVGQGAWGELAFRVQLALSW